MHWLDITVLVILGLFALLGLWRGLLRSVLDLANWLVSIVAAIFLAKPLTMLLNLMFHATDKLGTTISASLAKIPSLATAVGEATAASPFINGAEGVNWFLKKLLQKFSGTGVIASGATPANYFGTLLGAICMLIISGVIAFLVIRLIIFGLSKLFKALKKNNLINWVDKTLGLAFGAIKGFAVIGVCLFACSFFKWVPQINNTIEATKVTKKFAEWSTASAEFISKKIDVKKVLHGIMDNVYEAVVPVTPAPAPAKKASTNIANDLAKAATAITEKACTSNTNKLIIKYSDVALNLTCNNLVYKIA